MPEPHRAPDPGVLVLSDDDRSLIRGSWRLIREADLTDLTATLFRQHLLAHPDVSAATPTRDLSPAAFQTTLDALMNACWRETPSAGDTDVFTLASDFGREAHALTLACAATDALLAALSDSLGQAFSSDQHDAWTRLLHLAQLAVRVGAHALTPAQLRAQGVRP